MGRLPTVQPWTLLCLLYLFRHLFFLSIKSCCNWRPPSQKKNSEKAKTQTNRSHFQTVHPLRDDPTWEIRSVIIQIKEQWETLSCSICVSPRRRVGGQTSWKKKQTAVLEGRCPAKWIGSVFLAPYNKNGLDYERTSLLGFLWFWVRVRDWQNLFAVNVWFCSWSDVAGLLLLLSQIRGSLI